MPTLAIPLAEFDQEMSTTRRLLGRVPDGKGDWKPHPKSFPMAHLAQLVAWMPGWITRTLREPFIDLSAGTGYSMEDTATLLAEFDRNVASALGGAGLNGDGRSARSVTRCGRAPLGKFRSNCMLS